MPDLYGQITQTDRWKASRIILRELDRGMSRKDLANRIGVRIEYITYALNRSARKNETELAPRKVIKAILAWDKAQWVY